MGRLLVYLGRLILIVVGFVAAALAASAAMHLFILPTLGFETVEAGPIVAGSVLFSIPFVALFVAYFALTPALVVVAIAEIWSVRGWLYYALSGGAIGLAIALLFGSRAAERLTDSGPQPRGAAGGTIFETNLLAVLIGSGIVGGVVYWLIAGGTSGSWRSRAAQSRAPQ
jgi:hypothetical protein